MTDMKKYRDKDNKALGMNISVAQRKLVRSLLFKEIKLNGRDACFRCGQPIEDETDFSLDHIRAWRSSDNPKADYFDVNNVTYSHLYCNKKSQKH